MLYSLCLRIGCRHPDYLGLDLQQHLDWLAFDLLHPIGDEQHDDRAAWLLQPWAKEGATLDDLRPASGLVRQLELEALERALDEAYAQDG